MAHNHLIAQQQKENKIFNAIKICFLQQLKNIIQQTCILQFIDSRRYIYSNINPLLKLVCFVKIY